MSVAPNVSMVKDAFKTETHDVGIDKVIAGIRDGRWRECIAEIRRETDKETASKLKTCLPGITPSGIFSARKNGALVQHSGLLCADLDNLNGELLSAREKLLGSPYLYSLFTSPSGGGLKAFFRVPADGAKHRRSFRAVEKHVKELTGVQVDESCKDPARLCFVSYDPRTYYNPDAIELQPLPEPEKAKSVSNGEISPDLPLRERIATELLGPMTWSAEKVGHFCQCPGEALHGNATADRHAIVYLGGSPTLTCQHTSCSRIVEAFNTQLRSLLGKAERANVQDRVTPSGRRTGAANGHSDRQYAFCDLSKIGAKAVDWIEEPYLARGEMHFLQGQGGSYKGTLALTWAAEFSRRGENVLLVLAEDDLATKVKPLLMAAQADMGFIHPLTIRQGENEDALVLPDDLDQLEQAMAEAQAALVVIDPLLSHVSLRIDAYKDQHVKRVLTQIGRIAQRTNTVIVCVHHTKKDTSSGMKMAGMGSVAFYTTARVVLAMAKLSEDEVVLEVVKSNIGPEGVKQLLRADIVEPMSGIKCPRLTRAGVSLVGVAEALSCDRKDKETKAFSGAKLILDILEREGEQKQSTLFERVAEETESSPKTVRNKAYFGIIKPGGDGLGLVEVWKDQYQGELMIRRTNVSRPPKLQTVTSNCNLQSYTQGNGYTLGFSQVTDYSSKVTHCVSTPNCNRVTPREEIGYTLNGDKAASAISVTTEPVPPEGATIEDAQPGSPDPFIQDAIRLFNATEVRENTATG